MKKIAIFSLLSLFALSSFVGFAEEPLFTDILEDSPYYEGVLWAKESGVVKGYYDGTFAPERKVSRAEFLKIVLEARKMALEESAVPSVSPTPPPTACDDYLPYTNATLNFQYCIPPTWWWKNLGAVQDTLLRIEFYTENPENEGAVPVTFFEIRSGKIEKAEEKEVDPQFISLFPRNEDSHFAISGLKANKTEIQKMAMLMQKPVEAPLPSGTPSPDAMFQLPCDISKYSFPDIDPEKWYAEYICIAKRAGVVGGYPDGEFKPNETISFVAAAKIIANTFSEKPLTEDGEEWYTHFVTFLEDKKAVPASIAEKAQPVSRIETVEMLWKVVVPAEEPSPTSTPETTPTESPSPTEEASPSPSAS